MMPFWKNKTLSDMTADEWESLCDRCGRCCLQKLEDDETGRVHLTMVACKLLDVDRCRCSDYADRQQRVPGCVRLRPDNVLKLSLPNTCAYRLIAEGRDLPDWHPLVTDDAASVHEAGISVRSWAISERDVAEDDFQRYVLAEDEELV
jgi:uncharacterized protein